MMVGVLFVDVPHFLQDVEGGGTEFKAEEKALISCVCWRPTLRVFGRSPFCCSLVSDHVRLFWSLGKCACNQGCGLPH